MNDFKRVTALFLSVLFMLSVLSVSGFSAGTEGKPYRQYTVLGDSIPAGYGPYNYEHKGYARIPVSYPALVADKVAEDMIPLARTGFRTEELRYMLEDDYEGDSYLFRIGKTSVEDVYRHRPEYRPAIAGSDLITLEIGSNDILNYGMIRAIDASKNTVITNRVREILEETGDYGQALTALLSLGGTAESLTGIVSGFIQGMWEGYRNFTVNWDCIIEDIYSMNPDVTLVAVGMYNPLKTTKLTDVSLITIGRAFELVSVAMNSYMKQGSRYAGRYLFADVSKTEIYDLPAFTNGMFMDMLLGMVHPTINGHRTMANQVLKALSADVSAYERIPAAVREPRGLNTADHVPYVSGYHDGTFRPGKSATRAEVASMISVLLKDRPDDTAAPEFTDIAGHWGETQIRNVSALGIMKGYPDGSFRPDSAVSRGEAAAIAASLFDGNAAGTARFYDIHGHWAQAAIEKACSLGLIAGYEDGTFRPDQLVTRAQLVAILNEVLGRSPDIKSVEHFTEETVFPDVDPESWYFHDIMEAAVAHQYKINKDTEMWTKLNT